MFRPLDAAASRVLSREHRDVAEQWARYARSEAVHDRYFLRDLAVAGVPRSDVEGMQAFSATSRLGEFVKHAMRPYGAVPVVLYSFLAEHCSEAGSLRVAARNEAVFGKNAVRGATAHRALDAGQNHPALISDVLTALIRDESDLGVAIGLLEGLADLLGEYFAELDAWSAQPFPQVSEVQVFPVDRNSAKCLRAPHNLD